MSPPAARSRQVPDRTQLAADALLPALGLVAGLAAGVLLAGPAAGVLPRAPAFFGGWLLGLLVPRVHPHRYRVLGLAPAAALLAAGVAGACELAGHWPPAAVGAFCALEGTAVGAVLRHRDRFRADPARFVRNAVFAAGFCAAGVYLVRAAADGGRAYSALLLVAAGWAAVLAWAWLLRPLVEAVVEVPVRVMYRVTGAGPGAAAFPLAGPVLVVANHASWFDPLFLAGVLPRPITPIMTERFYKKWFLKPLLRYVFRVVVTPEAGVRREAPEVLELVAALDAGRCVVIFPEGYLRRTDGQLVRRFGQGVWQVLKARPGTPVVACWIEGAWGSYCSYRGGPPTKNKPVDVRRPVGVGVSAPEAVPGEVLAAHLPARVYLMNRVLSARAHLGLPPVPPVELPAREEDDGDRPA